ncbi:MAG: hypothetical protein R8M38_05220 [Mariprofundaceae bacterium]
MHGQSTGKWEGGKGGRIVLVAEKAAAFTNRAEITDGYIMQMARGHDITVTADATAFIYSGSKWNPNPVTYIRKGIDIAEYQSMREAPSAKKTKPVPIDYSVHGTIFP